MTKSQQYYAGSFFVGLVLALLFGLLATLFEADRAAYIAASATSGLAGIVGGIIYLVRR